MAWRNHFLDNLDEADLAALRPSLRTVELRRDQLLDEAGQPVRAALLPLDCILSVLTVMRDGRTVESRTIGHESGYGLLHALGSRISFERVITQVAGTAYELPVATLSEAAATRPSLTQAIVRHAQASLVQAAQSTACNTLHGAEHRLCRWLLLTQDRLRADVLPLTQEHLAVMLGVQRTTVTALASELQAKNLISYSRGRIRILDRDSLLRCACECYEAIERGAERVLNGDD